MLPLWKCTCVLCPEAIWRRRAVPREPADAKRNSPLLVEKANPFDQVQSNAPMIRINGQPGNERSWEHDGADSQKVRNRKDTADDFRPTIGSHAPASLSPRAQSEHVRQRE